jgi:hypothetical protein
MNQRRTTINNHKKRLLLATSHPNNTILFQKKMTMELQTTNMPVGVYWTWGARKVKGARTRGLGGIGTLGGRFCEEQCRT